MEQVREQLLALKLAVEKYDQIAEQAQQARWFARMVEMRLSDMPEKIHEAYEQVNGVESQKRDAFKVVQQLVPQDFSVDIETIRLYFLRLSTAYRVWGGLLQDLVALGVSLEMLNDEDENVKETLVAFNEKEKALASASKYLFEITEGTSNLKVF